MLYIKKLLNLSIFFAAILFTGCEREPMLHLHEAASNCTMDIPKIDLDLKVMWDYELKYDVVYDWEAEWKYGWDSQDKELFGILGYNKPSAYEIRRYFTHDVKNGKHEAPFKHHVTTEFLSTTYDFGFWDILAWNDIQTPDDVQSIRIDETSTYDYVTAETGQTMVPTRYNAPKFPNAFYQPEELFAGYESGIELNRNFDGFEYDADRKCWVRKMQMEFQPVTYIYLAQIILHNNHRDNRIVTSIDGSANLSGMARTVNLNTGKTGEDAITVNFNMRLKQDKELKSGEKVDIIGGKVLTFGIPKLNPSRLNTRAYRESLSKVRDADLNNRHYLDLKLQFYNGKDSTMVFDVTDQVRRLYRGGVITIDLDMDKVPVPVRPGGSGFDAVVKDFEEKQWEFDM